MADCSTCSAARTGCDNDPPDFAGVCVPLSGCSVGFICHGVPQISKGMWSCRSHQSGQTTTSSGEDQKQSAGNICWQHFNCFFGISRYYQVCSGTFICDRSPELTLRKDRNLPGNSGHSGNTQESQFSCLWISGR